MHKGRQRSSTAPHAGEDTDGGLEEGQGQPGGCEKSASVGVRGGAGLELRRIRRAAAEVRAMMLGQEQQLEHSQGHIQARGGVVPATAGRGTVADTQGIPELGLLHSYTAERGCTSSWAPGAV